MTKESNEARVELMKANWQVDVVSTRDLLTELGLGEEIVFETKEFEYNVLKLEEAYYLFEVPTDIDDGWRVGEINAYPTDKLHNLIVLLVEAKY